MEEYRYIAADRDGFVEQLVRYVATGHWFYFHGWIPKGKDPTRVDAKLMARYALAKPRWQRCREKRAGVASVHYLRYLQQFVLIATHGQHVFFHDHRAQIRDIRRAALPFMGYAIRYRYAVNVRVVDAQRKPANKWHVFVRMDRKTYRDLKAFFEETATQRTAEAIEQQFRGLPFEPYRPVREQLLHILRAVNRRRAAAGLMPISRTCIRSRRRISKPFGDGGPEGSAD